MIAGDTIEIPVSSPEWMTVEEVADYLKLSRSTLYDMAQNGEIPCSKVAGRWRFYYSGPRFADHRLKCNPTPAEGKPRRLGATLA